MKTAAILLAVSAAVTGEAPPPTYTHDEMQSAIVTAMEFGRQLGIAEVAGAIEETRKTLDRCAIGRPI